MHSSFYRTWRLLTLSMVLFTALGSLVQTAPTLAETAQGSYIVQASTTDGAAAAVVRAGGTVTQQLGIINAVVVTVNQATLARLQHERGLALHENTAVHASGLTTAPSAGPGPKETSTGNYLLYPSAATGAHPLQSMTVPTTMSPCANKRVTVSSTVQPQALQGYGVTVAFIDSGFLKMKDAKSWINNDPATGTLETEYAGRCVVYRDFLPRTSANGNTGKDASNSVDQNGHGTHVAATVGDYRMVQMAPNEPAAPIGVAPRANLLIARALDKNGSGSYADVIAAIQWVIQNKSQYNVRVLNLSLHSPVTGPYWADPMNQAVMKAWQAGITVVVAGGNDGPTAGTITVPGNVPYVITVGAVKSGRYTTSGFDEMATYSSRGPTESAFVKPDVLVPASQTIAPIPNASTLAGQIPAAAIKDVEDVVDPNGGKLFEKTTYYRLSGTSMAAAEVSGIVALMLQASPMLSNNQVKARLMATAQTAIDTTTGQPVYSFWEQGAGMANTQQAVFSTLPDSANTGMDINLDLDPNSTTHYWGYTTWDQASGQFQLIDPATGQQTVWDGAGKVWSGAGKVWSGAGKVWSGAGKVWSGAGKVWSGATTIWTGSMSLWAGSNRIWAGSTPATSLNTAAQTGVAPNN